MRGETVSNTLKKKDFETDQDVRWCPGCGDYSVLAAVQRLLPSFGRPREDYVFISGIGCSSRFPYYMNTYGFHTIHGRAPAIATGVKCASPNLSVWVITGDGDALSIGGNHLLHLIRRNVDVNILLFNNQIYGLTKGQYSPTSEQGKITKSTPFGSVDYPVNPLQFVLGAQATFVARTVDVDAKHMSEVLKSAEEHRGTSFVEIYQNCNIFNDKTFVHFTERAVRDDRQIQLHDGEFLLFGKEKDRGIRLTAALEPEVVNVVAGDQKDAEEKGVLRFDSSNLVHANILSRMSSTKFPVPVGVFHQSQRPSFDQSTIEQLNAAKEKSPPSSDVDQALSELFHSGDTWNIG